MLSLKATLGDWLSLGSFGLTKSNQLTRMTEFTPLRFTLLLSHHAMPSLWYNLPVLESIPYRAIDFYCDVQDVPQGLGVVETCFQCPVKIFYDKNGTQIEVCSCDPLILHCSDLVLLVDPWEELLNGSHRLSMTMIHIVTNTMTMTMIIYIYIIHYNYIDIQIHLQQNTTIYYKTISLIVFICVISFDIVWSVIICSASYKYNNIYTRISDS